MGTSINLKVYEVGKVLNEIEALVNNNGGYREGALPVRQWFTRVAPEFGVIEGDKFYAVWNEYYEDYNAASEFARAVERYYFPHNEDAYIYISGVTASEGANAEEVLSDLFPDEFGYEGKF